MFNSNNTSSRSESEQVAGVAGQLGSSAAPQRRAQKPSGAISGALAASDTAPSTKTSKSYVYM